MNKPKGQYNYKNKNEPSEYDILEVEGRIPPQALEIEEAVLGGMLIEQDALLSVMGMLKDSDFYKPAHKNIFTSMQKLFMDNQPVDMLSVENDLRDQGLLEACGGSYYISDLTRSVSSAANIEYHAQILIEKAIKRKLILECTQTIQTSYEPDTDPYNVLEGHEEHVYKLMTQRMSAGGNDIVSVKDILHEVAGNILDAQDGSGVTGIKTGLDDLDELLTGFHNEYYIIAARPSMGKTAFALDIAKRVSRQGIAVGIASLETSNESLVRRLIFAEAGVNLKKAMSGNLSKAEQKKVTDACSRLWEYNIFLSDKSSQTSAELRTTAKKMQREHNIGMFMVDYLQLAKPTDKHQNREREIGEISGALVDIKKELKIPVLALSQLSRALEQRTDKRPMLSDLRESGSLEQDAYGVMFLHRPEYFGVNTYTDGSSTHGITEVIVSKQKDGETGKVLLMFEHETMSFQNLAYQQHRQNEQNLPYKDDDDDDDYENERPF